MNDVQVIEILFDAISVVGRVAGPMLGAALLIGTTVSILQTVTQIQEQTLTFVPKLAATATILLVGGNWMIRELVTWVTLLWERIGTL